MGFKIWSQVGEFGFDFQNSYGEMCFWKIMLKVPDFMWWFEAKIWHIHFIRWRRKYIWWWCTQVCIWTYNYILFMIVLLGLGASQLFSRNCRSQHFLENARKKGWLLKNSKGEKTSALAQTSADLANHQKALEDTQQELATDSSSLSKTATACSATQPPTLWASSSIVLQKQTYGSEWTGWFWRREARATYPFQTTQSTNPSWISPNFSALQPMRHRSSSPCNLEPLVKERTALTERLVSNLQSMTRDATTLRRTIRPRYQCTSPGNFLSRHQPLQIRSIPARVIGVGCIYALH